MDWWTNYQQNKAKIEAIARKSGVRQLQSEYRLTYARALEYWFGGYRPTGWSE